MKSLKGHRTRLFNVAGMLPVILEMAGVPGMENLLPAGVMPWYVVGMGIANIALRQITTTPPGKKF